MKIELKIGKMSAIIDAPGLDALELIQDFLASQGAHSLKGVLSTMTQALDTLTTEVSEAKTVMASAVTLITGLKTRLDEAIAAQQAGDNGAALQALSSELDGATNELASAISSNTPAEGGNGGSGNGDNSGLPPVGGLGQG